PGVLKLSEIDGHHGSRYVGKMVISELGKSSLPGIHQVWRRYDANGHAAEDIIALLDERIPNAEPLLRPWSSDGYVLGPYPDKEQLRIQYEAGRNSLPIQIIEAGGKLSGHIYPVRLSPRTAALRSKVFEDAKTREVDPWALELLKYCTQAEIDEAMGAEK
ncbi:MAG: hypothetical protein AABZ57_06430, partial [Candidatus Margulisiibacteriota bacterium]